jgi:hypothetical protein
MSSGNKDSPEVVEFMTLFARLKDWSDDAPDELADLAATDASVKDLCDKLGHAAFFLWREEQQQRTLFAAPVDPAFLAAWRDYEERYAVVVGGILLRLAKPSPAPWAGRRWENADDEAARLAKGMDTTIEFALNNANLEHPEDGSDYQDYIKQVEDGVVAWHQLRQDIGFDLRGVLRRRALVPFVLVPRKVAAKHGSAERLSMLKNLQQAHDAFVFGATYAALALMRSIAEATLRDHYRAEGRDVSDLIDSARLPRGVSKEELHRLRKLANVILHLSREKNEGLPSLDEMGLEKEIVSLLFVLRGLIEGVK